MKSVALISAALAVVFLGGCASPETYRFRSTTNLPQSVTLLDTRTGESVWSQEVPVGRQLNVSFRRNPNTADSQGWDELRWSISDIGASLTGNSSTIMVPPPSERRLEVDFRPTPETRPPGGSRFPEGTGSTTMPAQPLPPQGEAPPSVKPKPAEGLVLPDPKQPAPR